MSDAGDSSSRQSGSAHEKYDPHLAETNGGGTDNSWFRAHYLGIPIPTYLWRWVDDDFILIDFNDAAEKITRGMISNFIGIKARKLYGDQPGILEDFKHCFDEKLVLRREMPYKFKSIEETKSLSVIYTFLEPDLILVHTEDISGLKQVRESLRESEEKYRTLVEMFPHAVAIFQDHMVAFANRAAAEMLGYDSGEGIIGLDVMAPVPLEDAARLDGYMIGLLNGDPEIPSNFCAHLRRKNGSPFTAEVYANAISFRGRPAVQLVLTDITERKQAESALRESEERFRSIWEHSPVGICLTDRHGVYYYVNRAYCDIYGYRREELLGKSFFDAILSPGHPQADRGNYASYFDNPHFTPLSETEIFTHKSGRPVAIQYATDFIQQSDGAIYMVTMNIDVTKRKIAEQALRESEAKYRMLIENQTDLIVKVDLDGRFVFVSPSYCKMFNKDESELLGHKLMPLVHKDDRESTARAMERIFEPPHSVYIEQRAETKDGWRWLAWADTAVLNEDGNVIEIIGVGRDITERKKAEAELLESEERYRLLFDNAAEVIARIDRDGRFLLLNKSAAKYLGGVPDDFIGLTLSDFFPIGQAEQFITSIGRVIDEGVSFSTEGIVMLPGNPRWFRTTIQPIADADSRVRSALMIATDIHSEKQVSIRNEARYNLLERLKGIREIDSCLDCCCQAIFEAQLFKRAVLTLHNEQREIINLGQVGLDKAIVKAAREAPAPNLETARKLTQDKYRIGHSFFIPEEARLIRGQIDRYIPQEIAPSPGPKAWQQGDELFVPLVASDGRIEGWLSVDTPFNGLRPSLDVINHLEESIDITSKHIHEIQGMESLQKKNITLKEVLAHIEEDKMEFRQRIGTNIEQVLIPALNKLVRKDGSINSTYYNILTTGLPELAASSGAITPYSKLSPREREVLNMIKNGLTSKEIAVVLSISLATVRKHRELIRRKLGITNKKIGIVNFLKSERQ